LVEPPERSPAACRLPAALRLARAGITDCPSATARRGPPPDAGPAGEV